MVLTPGAFVAIVRWLHFLAWMLALAASWYFVGYHFGKRYQQIIVVLLLCVRPAYAYLLVNMKPEPLVLLFLVCGLHYTLKIIERPRYGNLCMAVMFALLAFLVKFSGLFLLPTIIAAMYFAYWYGQKTGRSEKEVFPDFRISWALPMIIGAMILALLSSAIMSYVRKSTGLTWYAEYGYFGSLFHNISMLAMFCAGAAMVLLSLALPVIRRYSSGRIKDFADFIFKVNSYAFIVFLVFMALFLVFGIRWVLSPGYFISTFSQMAPCAVGLVPDSAVLHNFLLHIKDSVMALDPFICILFLFYAAVELRYLRRTLDREPLLFFKRMALVTFLLIPVLYICLMLRMFRHHMLPFFLVMSVLAVEGLRIFTERFTGRRAVKAAAVVMMLLLFTASIVTNAVETIGMRVQEFKKSGIFPGKE
jgi:hypothetical protein